MRRVYPNVPGPLGWCPIFDVERQPARWCVMLPHSPLGRRRGLSSALFGGVHVRSAGEIPAGINYSSNLKKLDLSDNQLTGARLSFPGYFSVVCHNAGAAAQEPSVAARKNGQHYWEMTKRHSSWALKVSVPHAIVDAKRGSHGASSQARH